VKRSIALTALLLLAGITASAAAMDADELIAKNVAATGGLKKIQSIETVKATGKFLTQGMEFPFTLTQKRPHKLRIDADIQGLSLIQAYDGETGWSINPMTGSQDPQPMGDIELKSFKLQADMDGPHVDYAAKGYSVEYIGEDEVEGTPVHQLRLDTHLGIVMDYFIDKDHFLTIKQTSKVTVDDNEIEIDTYLSDFQEINGVVVPMAIDTRRGDVSMNQIMIETLDHGVAVDDAIFTMPEKETVETAE
jgi:outer membrane lipoprotein-sorting protein